MKVDEVMTQGVRTCRESETLADAAQRMWESDCGCLPVLSANASGRVVGMITDRDVCLSSHFRGLPPGEIRIADVMSRHVRAVGPTATLAEAQAVMRAAQVRRLPVVSRDGQLVGLVSLADLVRGTDARCGWGTVTEQELRETLRAICSPRPPRGPGTRELCDPREETRDR